MKKILALFLALLMLFSLVACGNRQATTPSTESSQSTTDKVENITESTEGTTGTTKIPIDEQTSNPTDETITSSTQTSSSAPSSTKLSAKEPSTAEPSATEPPVAESSDTEPPAIGKTETEKVFDFRSIVNNYSGTWYLKGYSDVYISVWESSFDHSLQIDAVNFALPPTSSPVSAYSVYPYKHFLDMPNSDYWSGGFELYNDPTSWNDSLGKYNLKFADGYISLGGCTFVRNAGSIDQYSDTCYRSALGFWYLENHPTSTLDIRLEQDYGLPCGHYFTIVATDFNFSSLDAFGGDIVQGWAGRQNNWTQYGISVEGNVLVVSNGIDTRYFYREPTEPSATEPPTTESLATEPPVTEPPVTEPSATEPPATEPPAVEEPLSVRVSMGVGFYMSSSESVQGVFADTTASGGSGNYVEYYLKVYHNGNLVAEGAQRNIVVTVDNGTYIAEAYVKDSDGNEATATESITLSGY